MVLSPNIIIQFKQITMRITELLHNILYVFVVSVTVSNITLEDITTATATTTIIILIIMAFTFN